MLTATDILAAAATKWSNAALPQTITGGLYSGRPQGEKTPPYAIAEVKPLRNQLYFGAAAGEVYYGVWRLTVTLYGIGEKATGDLLKGIATVFADQGGSTIAGGKLMHCLPADDAARLELDPQRKEGEDRWRGILTWEIMASGTM